MPEDYVLNYFNRVLDSMSIEEILESSSDYESAEILAHLYQAGFLNITLRPENLELNFD